tara:strand:- start:5496 stop:5909 length:414 start_codon:yes stop_codon:yes gene_type:complete
MAEHNDLKEQLRQAIIALGKPELTDLAYKVLGGQQQQSPPTETQRQLDFISTITPSDASGRRTPVNEVKNRVNQFVDDRTDALDISTPDIQPVARRRSPTKKVQQQCGTCGEVEKVAPVHQRDFYVCGRCLKNKSHR